MNLFTIKQLEEHLFEQLKLKTKEYQRAFHGRGGLYLGFEFLTVDFINDILYLALFNEVDDAVEKELIKIAKKLFETKAFECVIFQKRYLKQENNSVLFGTLPKESVAYENELKFYLNMSNNQNIGLFADMKKGREFISSISQGKKVLNLFSYTCAFSIYAAHAGALKVVNVDMAKAALSMGRSNHHLNNLSTKNIEFMPYNILKSWNRIKKSGPYDVIIIDPPSFQKGSFAATKDYVKIIKKLSSLANDECMVLACLNDPRLDSQYLKDIFSEHAPEFVFEKRLGNLKSYENKDEEQSLKNLIFRRSCSHQA